MNHYIIKYNEIFLKGKNKPYFEKILIKNIKHYFKKNNLKHEKIIKKNNRLIIESSDSIKKYKNLGYVFGISYICKSTKTELNLEKIKTKCLNLVKKYKNETFKINTKRENKNFEYNSIEINRIIGNHIIKKTKLKVDLSNPNITVFVEILDNAYIYTNKEIIKGPGGLPIGTEGTVLSLIEDNRSVLASLLMMKRGCKIIPIFRKKAKPNLLNLMEKYSYGFDLSPIKLNNLKETEAIAKKEATKAIILNQTLENYKNLKLSPPILRPLASYRNKDIIEELSKFDR